MPFSFAIFSADCPIVSPVEGSATAGQSGTRSRGLSAPSAESRAPHVRARWASTSARASPRLSGIGTFESDSAPPATPASRLPSRISAATSAIAWLAEAQARFTVWAGTSLGRPTPSPTSRARFGAWTEGTTWPMTTAPIAVGSTSDRSRSSRTQAFPRSIALSSLSVVPERAKGVRHPAMTATLFSGMECQARVGRRFGDAASATN
jgi:hypothetical protein